MTINMRHYAVIDADFYIKLTQYASDKGALFLQLMKDLGMQPVMHAYIVNVELRRDTLIHKLVELGCIEVRNYDDYLVSEEDRADYEEYFLEAYERMNRFEFPEKEDIYSYSCEDESLGEIRSIYMAKKLEYDYLMSDDGGAKRLAKAFLKAPIVLNVYHALLRCKERGTSITLKQLNPTITNVFRERQEQLKMLRERYAQK